MVAGLKDTGDSVRGEAGFALGQLSESCEDVVEQHGLVLPALFAAMDAAQSPDTLHRLCYGLDAFSEHLGTAAVSTMPSLQCDVLQGTWNIDCH